MRKTLLMAILFCLAVSTIAQTTPQRRIYLWDVTLTMWGLRCVGGVPIPCHISRDIYDEVRNFLIQDIQSIDDEDTEIFVLPFQESIMVNPNEWRVNADEAGKQRIIQKIINYPRQGCSWTDIVHSIQQVKSDIIRPDRVNRLVLLTDGLQSDILGGRNAFKGSVSDWNRFAERNSAYLLYVMLTPEGRDEILETFLRDSIAGERFIPITEFITLRPENAVVHNFVDNRGDLVDINLQRQHSNEPIPSNIQIRVVADNEFISVDEVLEIRNGKISFRFTYNQTEDVLREILPAKTLIPLHLEVVNSDELQQREKLIFIDPNVVELQLINRPEKILRIRYE